MWTQRGGRERPAVRFVATSGRRLILRWGQETATIGATKRETMERSERKVAGGEQEAGNALGSLTHERQSSAWHTVGPGGGARAAEAQAAIARRSRSSAARIAGTGREAGRAGRTRLVNARLSLFMPLQSLGAGIRTNGHGAWPR